MTTVAPQIYDQDYRHFDVLIWQVPTWASAIFTFTTTTAGVVVANLDKIENGLNLDPLKTLSVFVLAVFGVLLLLSNVLIRFRIHQGCLPPPRATIPRPNWQLRGHTALQLIIAVEAAVLLAFGLYCAGAALWLSNSVALVLVFVGFPVLEAWYLGAIKLQRAVRQ